MAKAKKFGAFAGVFTPSILTILGVIMYMRLGWVVGQAGIINAVIIIMLAHVISLSTGLSVSSIATDKKIKAGGIYYILSRSLGLPMGGSIGIALFIGTALSISLYLVGFAENFLSIEPIRDFLGLEENRFGYQVVGTGAILLLVMIAFISTSLAIKTQFYILGAIALSLVSIGVGFFLNTDVHPETVLVNPAPEAIPMELIFAIFFPAVTGFTAGVAMSGDLKDPKKAIPSGTMFAIITGFVVYVILAIGIAFFVKRDILLTDNNFLMKIAWFSPLVIAGVWGATLSSALGGILGGPRILQAMSSDRIAPSIFARVYGVNQEPRTALILIFLIAEAGILIGELNVIAGIVSMFYLASYGFINIAYYLESWASTDFRPSFKISRYIGLVGFVAAFGVMFQLDMLSMFAALIIMMGIYFFLKRKQLKLDYGDVWQSVWSSLMRTALKKMDSADEVERNWQPNIILFSGGTKKRPHLLNLGQCLVGRHGVLSNFDLIENKDAQVLFPKKNQSIPGETSAAGVFTRRQTVKNIYDGIDMISRTYGFSGLEPNTVMLGWARQARNPVRFVEMIKTLYDLDLNVLMLGYDKQVGFGKKQSIDIWFKDKSNHGNLALTLSKLLILSDEWHSARVRVLIVNYQNKKSDAIYRKMEILLDNMRVDAEVKVINNQVERRSFYDIVEIESSSTDLVFLEIPKIKKGFEQEFVDDTDKLLDQIGTVMLIEASSSFKKLKFGFEESGEDQDIEVFQKSLAQADLPELSLPKKTETVAEINALHDSLKELNQHYLGNSFLPLFAARKEKMDSISQAIQRSFSVIEQKFPDMAPQDQVNLIGQLKTGLLVRIGKIIDDQLKYLSGEIEDNLEIATDDFLRKLNDIINNIPERVGIHLTIDDLLPNPDDSWRIRSYKRRQRIIRKKMLKGVGIPYPVKLKALSVHDLPMKNLEALYNAYSSFGQYNITYIFEVQKLLYAINDTFSYLENYATKKDILKISVEARQSIQVHQDRLVEINKEIEGILPVTIQVETLSALNSIGEKLKQVPANIGIVPAPRKDIRVLTKTLQSIPGKWGSNHRTLLKYIHIETQLLLVEFRLNKIIREVLNEIHRLIGDQVLNQIKELDKALIKLKSGSEASRKKQAPVLLSLTVNQLQLSLNKLIDKAFRNIKKTLRQIPESVEVFTEDTVNEITNKQFDELETMKIPVFRLVDYFVQNELIAPLLKNTNDLVQDIHSSATKISDAARLMSLSAQNGNGSNIDESYNSYGDVSSFLAAQEDLIKENAVKIENDFEKYRQSVLLNMNKSSSDLHLFRLARLEEAGTHFTREEARKQVKFLRSRFDRLKLFIQKQRANLWYSQSEARLLAKKLVSGQNTDQSILDKILSFKDIVAVNQKNLEKLPFYYQQLFLSKYNYQAEFWYGRSDEVSQARKAMSRFKSGNKGTIIITGDRRSGKSFFANHLTSFLKDGETVFTISPAGAGSIERNSLIQSISDSIERSGSLDEMMSGIPPGSVFIFDDMELWWERSENGSALMETIFDIIRQYNEKYLFILVFNGATYKLINQLVRFDDYALQKIDLQAFNSKELQEIILFRHRTSGFSLQVDRFLPAGMSQSRQARFFNRVFKFSGGNVGGALLCWVASIKDFKNNTVYMQTPVKPDYEILEGLSSETKIYLIQFILHKRLTVDKLQRIMQEDEEKISYNLQYLKRAGLVQEQADRVFEIEQYLQNHITRYILENYDKLD